MTKSNRSSSTSKHIVVTGGAGAIGCHVVRQLAVNYKVTVVDNLSSGSLAYLPEENVTPLVFDIRDNDKLEALFRDTKVHAVVHLAAHFANQNSVDFPITDLDVNISGTLALLKLCHAHETKFIYASSSCVYGQKLGQLSENLPIDDLHTPYAISKYGGELYTKFYAEHFGMSSLVLRFFNNFGPYENPGRYRNVIPNFIARALQGEPLMITGTGEETRDFNYVENTAHAVELALEECLQKNISFDVFNVGTGQETTILEIAEKVKALTGSISEIQIAGQRRSWDHTVSRCADISAISSRLGYQPRIGLNDGLSNTVTWFEKNPKIWQ